MRSAALTGLAVAAVVAALGWGRALSNADFIYMCCGARLLADGGLPASAYFPPGYPALLCLMIQSGLSALSAGALLSALGSGLSASAVVWTARRLKLPVVLAVALGLLGASLPDVFEIAYNPHLDALYTGMALWLIALALAVLAGDQRRGVLIAMIAAAALLLTLRYHAVIVVVPIALVLALHRERVTRRAGLWGLAVTAVMLVVVYGMLYSASGSLAIAVCDQVRTGCSLHFAGSEPAEVFSDYQRFLSEAPPCELSMLSGNAARVWPDFLARKMVLIGLALWLIALLTRNYPARSHWLLLLIIGYTLAVSVTYYTPRASALPELAALLLVVLSLSALFGGWSVKDSQPVWLARPMLTGLLVLLAVAALGYNAWRERVVIAHWHRLHEDVHAANAQAVEYSGNRREQLFGPLDYTAWPVSGRYCLPGSTYSRLWLDDPRVAHVADSYIPRVDSRELLSGNAAIGAILLWERHGAQPGHAYELQLIEELERSYIWREVISEVDGTRLWVPGP